MRRRDAIEAAVNTVAGLAVSAALVAVLRAAGAWDAHPIAVSAPFVVASWGRSYALRRLFRWMERRNG